MYGVVLWSDPQCDRALIWCEDHGSLAFYNAEAKENENREIFESGDLVRFKTHETQDMRIAENLEVVATEEYPYLARELREAGHVDPVPMACANAATRGGNVVPFTATASKPSAPVYAGGRKVAAL